MRSDRIPQNAGVGASEKPGATTPESDHRARVERLFREHNETLVRVLNARLRSPQEAREVAQEAYVQLLGLNDPGAVGYLQAFLFKTAINIASNRLKHQARKERLDPLVFFETEAERISPAPDRQCLAAQELSLIHAGLESLPPKPRMAFLLCRVDGLTVEETAKRMHLHPRTAYRYVAVALAHCARALDGCASPREAES